MKLNVDLKEAVDIVLSQTSINEIKTEKLIEGLGCILAESIVSNFNIPHFEKSPLDGFAVIAEDTMLASEDSPVVLRVKEFISAGIDPQENLSNGEAARIMTGAKIPSGANAVIGFEKTTFNKDDVSILDALNPGDNIIRIGEDLKAGEVVMDAGTKLSSAEIGMLSAMGRDLVKVYRRPKIGFIATGDELLKTGEELQEGKVYDVNSHMLVSRALKLNCEVKSFGICRDDVSEISRKLMSALEWADIVVTTGGVSVGDMDLMKASLDAIGADTLFWRIKIKPGTPALLAKYGSKLVFGLSGNPAASYITFEKLVKPSILKKFGSCDVNSAKIRSNLKTPFDKSSSQNRIVRARTYYLDGEFCTEIPKKNSSGVVSSLSGANSLLFIPANSDALSEGDNVLVEMIDEMEVM